MNPENQTHGSVPPEAPLPSDPPQPRLNWPGFLIALFAPPALTFLCALAKLGDAAFPVALFGSGVGGIVCGVLLGKRAGKSTGVRVALGLLFAVIFAVVCFVMSFMGCMAGGFKVNMR